MHIIRPQLRHFSAARTPVAVLFLLLLLAVLAGSFYAPQPRPRAVSEVPIAFWAWRRNAPSERELQKAAAATKAKILFLRAGQIDLVNGTLQRIRLVSGPLPASVELHLVYNGTRKFLREWEQFEADALAASIANTFCADLVRASHEQALVAGLQLDFDAPTRLLPQYAQTLQRLRTLLPPDTKLSITGLPTWANARDLKAVLAAVDFWIPQCYGTNIPTHINQRIPISSPSDVARTISQIRQLGKPFYAGLSAYGYALLYAKDGRLLELRGDLDPAWAAHNTNLELVERRTFTSATQASEMRYVYRAKSDVVLDGLILQAGEALVFDWPSAASLRASARAVRENAGEQLLGICVFRLPMANDETTLSVGEIAAALTDTDSQVKTTLTAKSRTAQRLQLHIENNGTTRAMLGAEAVAIELDVPAGSLKEVAQTDGLARYETLCRASPQTPARSCSQRRANVLRLMAHDWKSASIARADLVFTQDLPPQLTAVITTQVNDGRIVREEITVEIFKIGASDEE